MIRPTNEHLPALRRLDESTRTLRQALRTMAQIWPIRYCCICQQSAARRLFVAMQAVRRHVLASACVSGNMLL